MKERPTPLRFQTQVFLALALLGIAQLFFFSTRVSGPCRGPSSPPPFEPSSAPVPGCPPPPSVQPLLGLNATSALYPLPLLVSDASSSGSSWKQALPKRPPRRIPAAGAAIGTCFDPAFRARASTDRQVFTLPAHLHTSALTAAFELADEGLELLGPCECPVKQPHGEGGAFSCADHDARILSELAPWHGINVTHAMLDSVFSGPVGNLPPTYHFSVQAGLVHVKEQGPLSSHDPRLKDMLKWVASQVALPDVEFLLHGWDHAKVHRQDAAPVFCFQRDAGMNDLTFPSPYLWSVDMHDFAFKERADHEQGLRLEDASEGCPPFSERLLPLMWRGSCNGPTAGYKPELWPAYLRARASLLSDEHPDLIDARLSEQCLQPPFDTSVSGPPGNTVPLGGPRTACKHRHLLLLDGNSASGRLSHWLHSGSTVFKPDSKFSEWHYHLLRPWVEYWPVREFLEDAVEQMQAALRFPEAAQCMGEQAKRHAKRHLTREAVACYVWRLLTAWAALQPEKSRGVNEGFSAL